MGAGSAVSAEMGFGELLFILVLILVMLPALSGPLLPASAKTRIRNYFGFYRHGENDDERTEK